MYYYHKKPWRSTHKNAKKNWVLLIVVIIIVGSLLFWHHASRYNYLISTPVDPYDDSKISIAIKKGDSINNLAKTLKNKNLILDENAFREYMRNSGLDHKIVAGRFMLQKTQTIPDIAKTITESKNAEYILTIPEGSTVRDIDNKLAAMDVISSGDFIKAVKEFSDFDKYPFLDKVKTQNLEYPLEGYLFPDTYFIDPQNFHSENLIQLMLNNFAKKLDYNLTTQHHHSLFDIIIMASIVEKEIKTDKDRPIVAGILWKRLDNNWMLGADATLLYLKKNDRNLNQTDLKSDSPYNTRNRAGLPPGPICNPGLKSILAAINPEESPYFYYLTNPENGQVIYAVTNDQHNANKLKYL